MRIEPQIDASRSGAARTPPRASGEEFAALLATTAPPERSEVAAAAARPPARTGGGTVRMTPTAGRDVVVTPFGEFERDARSSQVVNVKGASENEISFKTHAPAEWMDDKTARARFVEIYGEAALVTLDWTGTVPDNVDPAWITVGEVDDTGRPLPKSRGTAQRSKVLS